VWQPPQLGQLDPSAQTGSGEEGDGSKAVWMTVAGVTLFVAAFGGLLWFAHTHPEMSRIRPARVGMSKGGWFAGYEFGSYNANRKTGYEVVMRASAGAAERETLVPTKTAALKLAQREAETGRYERVTIVDRSTGKAFWERWAPRAA
jgi:hypothetical protein